MTMDKIQKIGQELVNKCNAEASYLNAVKDGINLFFEALAAEDANEKNVNVNGEVKSEDSESAGPSEQTPAVS